MLLSKSLRWALQVPKGIKALRAIPVRKAQLVLMALMAPQVQMVSIHTSQTAQTVIQPETG
jgi:hypothetical protein